MQDIRRLATTNEALSDKDINDVKAQRQLVQEQLNALEKKLELEKQGGRVSWDEEGISDASAARLRQKQLSAQLSACNTALAPHKRLPAELLSHIFIAAYPEATVVPVEVRSSPLALCRVCSRWRSIALETPELWTSIILRFSRSLDPYGALDIAKQWFRRSGLTSLLSLVLMSQYSGMERRWDQQRLKRGIVKRLIIPFAPRFWRLHLYLPAAILFPFLRSAPRKCSCLRQLSIAVDGIAGMSFSGPMTAFNRENSPYLDEMEVRSFDEFFPLDTVDLSWSTVTRLNFVKTPITFSQSYSLLKQCRRLAECQLSVSIDPEQDEDDFQRPKQTLPHLTSLTVEFSRNYVQGSIQVDTFFRPFILPSLKVLHLGSNSPYQHDWGGDPFMEFLTQSSCVLDILSMTNISFESAHAGQIVEALPSLMELRIGLNNILSVGVLKRIGSGELLPLLKVLVCCIGELEWIIDLLEKRWQMTQDAEDQLGLSCPDYVMVDYLGPRIRHQQATRIDQLRAKGLAIQATRSDSCH